MYTIFITWSTGEITSVKTTQNPDDIIKGYKMAFGNQISNIWYRRCKMIELIDIYNIVADYICERPVDDENDLASIMDVVGDQVRSAFCDFADDNDMDFYPTF